MLSVNVMEYVYGWFEQREVHVNIGLYGEYIYIDIVRSNIADVSDL